MKRGSVTLGLSFLFGVLIKEIEFAFSGKTAEKS